MPVKPEELFELADPLYRLGEHFPSASQKRANAAASRYCTGVSTVGKRIDELRIGGGDARGVAQPASAAQAFPRARTTPTIGRRRY